MDPGFQIKVIYRDDDVVELRITGWNGAFGGAADAYVGVGDLERIAEKLQGFPKHPSDTREIVFGAFGHKSAGGGVNMLFYCPGSSGQAHVEAKIESSYDSAG